MEVIIFIVTSIALTWVAIWSIPNVNDLFDAFDVPKLPLLWSAVWLCGFLVITLLFYGVALLASTLLLGAALALGLPDIICAAVVVLHLIFCDKRMTKRRRS